jgi:hypothetical protein
MPAKNIYHNLVKNALIKVGWTITDDPLSLQFGGIDLYVDLGAEQLIVAEKESQKIAVEIKSFLGESLISEFHTAVGQFLNYRVALKVKEPNRVLFLAVPVKVYRNFFYGELAQLSISEYHVKILVFDPEQEVIVEWNN